MTSTDDISDFIKEHGLKILIAIVIIIAYVIVQFVLIKFKFW